MSDQLFWRGLGAPDSDAWGWSPGEMPSTCELREGRPSRPTRILGLDIIMAMIFLTGTAVNICPYLGVHDSQFTVVFATAWMSAALFQIRAHLGFRGHSRFQASPQPHRRAPLLFYALGLAPWVALPFLDDLRSEWLIWNTLNLPTWARWVGATLAGGGILWPFVTRSPYSGQASGRVDPQAIPADVMQGNDRSRDLAYYATMSAATFLVSASLFIGLMAAAGLVLVGVTERPRRLLRAPVTTLRDMSVPSPKGV